MASPTNSPFEGCAGLAGAEPQEWDRDHIQDSTFIGLDVHKATISVAVARGESDGEVQLWDTVPHRPDHIRKLVEKLGIGGHRLHFCYEEGPCGYGLYRQLVELGHDCIVLALSLIPVKAGVRVKTDPVMQ